MNNTVFIAGLSHSGSTLFDMVLGGHSRFIGLGELALVSRTLMTGSKDLRTNLCACGKTAGECSFWGSVLSDLSDYNELNQTRIYDVIYKTFSSKYGPDYTLVDSSKYLHALDFSKQYCADNLRALHLIKDVRPFSISQIDNAKRKNRKCNSLSPYRNLRKWYSGNCALENGLKNSQVNFITVGYEDLCLYSEHTLRRICKFLEVEYEPRMLELNQSGSHSIMGNRMRSQTEKKVIRYDNRWFTRKEWMTPALLNPRIMKYNAEKVYAAESMGMWKK